MFFREWGEFLVDFRQLSGEVDVLGEQTVALVGQTRETQKELGELIALTNQVLKGNEVLLRRG